MNSKRPIPKDICISKIETAIKKLKVALKKEKVAAVAKTIRLLKGSKGDDNATHKLEALKKIDFHQLAVNFVAAELKKRYQRYYRDLAGWAPVIASASSITELERDLLSSKHSMAAQESCFAQLDRTILGIRIQKAVSKKEPKNKIAIPETRLPTEEDAWTSEEDEDLDMIEAMPKAKKNRRGQKERRTYYECNLGYGKRNTGKRQITSLPNSKIRNPS